MPSLTYRQLSHAEQPGVLPLLGKCFPAYWEQRALTLHEFPFDETSFAALDGDRVVGHCGVITYRISDGNGGTLLCGGIASVAVAPDYRKQGIARSLCLNTIPWAEQQHFDSLTLYTEFFRVYESAGWKLYDVPAAQTMAFNLNSHARNERHSVLELTDDQRRMVQALYESGEDFRGKVLRGNANEFNSWNRLLRDPDYTIALADGAYALFCDDVMVELNCHPAMSDDALLSFAQSCADATGRLHAYLPAATRVWRCIASAAAAVTASPIDVMHHERPMFLDLSPAALHTTSVFYPIGDKF